MLYTATHPLATSLSKTTERIDVITKEEYKCKTSKARRMFHKHILLAIKATERCTCCGSNVNLTFHHLDRSQKRFNIPQKLFYDLPKLLEEVDRCIVICKKCHRDIDHEEDLRLALLTKQQRKEARERRSLFRSHLWMWLDA
jgi:hypothetical protein